MKRTFAIERVFHQLMEPRGVPREQLVNTVAALSREDFIELHLDGPLIRYSETDKLTNGENKKELFKLLERMKRGPQNINEDC